jgi:glutaredoxin
MRNEGRFMLFPWRWLWFRRKVPVLDHVDVVLYTRPGCHLCETAWEFLRHEQRRYRFQFRVVNVDTDPELVKLYGNLVPVVTVNGKVRFRGGVNPVLWRRLLHYWTRTLTRCVSEDSTPPR